MRISVVIPTYKRKEKLQDALSALCLQNFPKAEYEVVVVDDGSCDGTSELVRKLSKRSPAALRLFSQENKGQGSARNRGVEEAAGDIVIFIGADIIVTPDFIREHDRMHRAHSEENAGVLGFVTWHPKLNPTPLMKFMEKGGAVFGRFGGHQFAYDLLKGKQTADYRFFYTSNISLKRSLLLRHAFDPWFSTYGWEDIELGYRLSREVGLQLYYNQGAFAYHDHSMDEEQFISRMRNIGRSAHIIHQKYPELMRVPSARKKFIFRMLCHPWSLRILRLLSLNMFFYAASKKYFLQGLETGYNDKETDAFPK
ncbi:glycosyltransferase family 2 protein [Candidatus Peregrinibacteria bacterium]|nr:glycosyltransferase family 2 protein [Candidatus Peregrinibacteria bacterium]